MFDLDDWQEVLSTLRKNPLRTLMTAWGVFWGTFMLVLMLGFGTGLEHGVQKNMLGFAPNNVYMWGNRTSKPFRGMPTGRWVKLKLDDMELIRRSVTDLEALAPRIQLGGWQDGNNVTYGEKTANFGVMGEYPEFAVVEHVNLVRGRFVNQLDFQLGRKVAVIGSAVQRILFPDGVDPLGQYIKIKGVHFQVVGVTGSERSGEQGDRDNNTVQIPFTTFQRAFNSGERVGWFSARARPGVDSVGFDRALRRAVATSQGFDPEDQQALGSFNTATPYARVRTLFSGIRFFIWFVSIATLLAGALGVSNIMLVSVKERTREFGLRKALGATPGTIVRQVLQEASVLTALAGYLGVVVGVATLELARRFLGDGQGPLGAPDVDLGVVVVATLFLSASGVVAGIAPARHAARIQPVVALRSE
jgi:putative ABC transport system permease protein